MSFAARITGLFIYPVKGCAGIPLDEAQLTARGLRHDRRWMIVNAAGRFQTQRELPRLATLRPRLADGELRLALGDRPSSRCRWPISASRSASWCGAIEVTALAVDPALDRALSAWLGKPVRLVRFPEHEVRPCDPEHAPHGSHTGFADGFPLLVTSEGSLAELNAALATAGAPPVPMSRFRPNLVLDGVPAGAEDRCAYARARPDAALAVKRCDRCVVTTIDQDTGVRTGREPIATLKRIRRNERTGGAWFGQNAVPRLTSGATVTLRVGGRAALHEPA